MTFPTLYSSLVIDGLQHYLRLFLNFQMSTLRMIVLFNFGGFCTIVLLTHLLAKGAGRIKLLGWICVVFATSVFAAPLSIIVSISYFTTSKLPSFFNFIMSRAIKLRINGLRINSSTHFYCIKNCIRNLIMVTSKFIEPMILFLPHMHKNEALKLISLSVDIF